MRTRQEQNDDTRLRRRVLRTPGLTFKKLGGLLGTSTQTAERLTLPPGHERRISLSLELARKLKRIWPDFDVDTYDLPAGRPAKPRKTRRAGA